MSLLHQYLTNLDFHNLFFLQSLGILSVKGMDLGCAICLLLSPCQLIYFIWNGRFSLFDKYQVDIFIHRYLMLLVIIHFVLAY